MMFGISIIGNTGFLFYKKPEFAGLTKTSEIAISGKLNDFMNIAFERYDRNLCTRFVQDHG